MADIGNVKVMESTHIRCCGADLPPESIIYFISVFSAAATMFAGIGGVASWNDSGSVLMLGLGMINFIEFFRNLIIIWRFTRLTEDTIEILMRDDKSSILITSMMLFIGNVILILSIVELQQGYEEDVGSAQLLAISIPSTIFFGILGYIKMKYARILKSSALALDGLSSWLFSMFLFVMMLSTLIIKQNPAAWWLDPLIAIILASTCITISADVLYVTAYSNGVPCCTLSYWSSDQNYYERRHENQFSSIEMLTFV